MINVRKIDTFSGHRNSVYALAEADAPHLFFSAGGDGLVVQWDLTKPDWGQVVAQIPSSVYALAFDQRSGYLWVGQNFEGFQVIDPQNKKVVFSSKITSVSIFDIQILGNQAFMALEDGVVVVVDTQTYAVIKHIKASDKSARCVAIDTQSGQMAVGYSDNAIRVFDLNNYALKNTLLSHTKSVFTVRFSPNGRFLLSGGRDAHLKVWEVSTGFTLVDDIVAHLYAINHIAYSPDSNYFVTCSMDKAIKLWDAHNFRLLKVIDKARHAGHATSINKLLWISYQHQLVSCSDDRQVSVWQFELS